MVKRETRWWRIDYPELVREVSTGKFKNFPKFEKNLTSPFFSLIWGMAIYLIIQLILLLGAVIIGIYNAWLGMSRAGMWTFPRRRHQVLGIIFFSLILIVFLITLLSFPSFRRLRIRISGYLGLSWLIFLLSLVGAALGIIKSQKKTILSRYKRIESTTATLHPWPIILAIGLSFAQIFNLLNRLF